jgi:hypothetical protein
MDPHHEPALLKAMKQDPPYRNLPAVVMSALPESAVAEAVARHVYRIPAQTIQADGGHQYCKNRARPAKTRDETGWKHCLLVP